MSKAMKDALAYVAVDVGVSTLRAWLLDAEGNVLNSSSALCEACDTSKPAFEALLLELVKAALPDGRITPVICSGFGSLDWPETRFESVPCKTPEATLMYRVNVHDPRVALWRIPGLRQNKPDDVMGTDVVQISGFLAEHPKFDGVICLPGAHSKWVRVSAEEIVSFQTYLTGELIDLLSEYSAIRQSVETNEIDKDVFLEALGQAMSRPQSVAAKLFGLKASHLLSNQSLHQGKSSLLGQMIGLELAGARPYWLGMDIAVIGSVQNAALYSEALSAQGCLPKVYDGEAMLLSGMQHLFIGLMDA